MKGAGGPGGKRTEIALSSLPLPAQIKYREEHNMPTEAPPALAPQTSPKRIEKTLDELPKFQQETVHQRLVILDAWQTFCQQNKQFKKTDLLNLFAKRQGCSARTLQRWETSYREAGWAGLVTSYGNRSGISCLGHEDISIIEANYLTSAQLPAREVFRIYTNKMRAMGRPFASYETVLRYIRNGISEEAKVWYRQGPHAFTDKCMPYLERDYTTLRPMQAICGDHHYLDAMVRGAGGKPVRPHLTMWSDIRSRRPVGWVLSYQGCGETILLTLHQAISRFGLPEIAYCDNGKDYKGNQMTGGGRRHLWMDAEQLNEAAGIWLRLGIKPVFAEPYHGQSKPIERSFRDIKDGFSRHLNTYTGGRPSERPHDHAERLEGKVYELAELNEIFTQFVEKDLVHRAHTGQGMDGRSMDEVFRTGWVKRRVDPEELRLLLMKTRPCTRQQNGVKWNYSWYWSDDLMHKTTSGQRLIARFDPMNIGVIYIYDEHEQFICAAEKQSSAAWFAGAKTERDVQKIKRVRAKMKDLVEAGRVADAVLYQPEKAYELGLLPDPEPTTPEVVAPQRTSASAAVRMLKEGRAMAANADFTPEELDYLEGVLEQDGGESSVSLAEFDEDEY